MKALSPRTPKKRKSAPENVSKGICFHDAELSVVLTSVWADGFHVKCTHLRARLHLLALA